MRKKAVRLLTVAALSLALPASAMEGEAGMVEEIHRWAFDAPTIERGYTVQTPDEQFNVGILPNVLKGETDVTVKVFDHVALAAADGERLVMNWPVPEGKKIISPVYEFDIKGAQDLHNPEKPIWLRFHYIAGETAGKGVYYWHKGEQKWVEIPTEDNRSASALQAAIHLTYAPMAILADEIASEGQASWYKYKDCNCAASRDYPKGTKLKVTDLQTEKEVIVVVNDYGPEEWTERIIDLDVKAFEQLTEKWRGVTEVRVEPYLNEEL